MASTSHKDHHDEKYDPRVFLETYAGPNNKEFMELLVEYPLQLLFKTLSSGVLNGNTLINLIIAPTFVHLPLLVDYFKEIIMVGSSDVTLRETEKWLKNDPGAVDWTHCANIISSFKGEGTCKEHQEKVRGAVKPVLKCDFTKDKPLDPVVLDPVDCVYNSLYLESVSKDRAAYISNLKKFTSLLKVGGHLVLFVPINMSYYMINNDKFFILTIDEDFIKKVLRDLGFTIVNSELYQNTIDTHLFDHKHIFYVVACKKK
ncbi:nicotinamide N-methyltransferase-like isoform X2 [Mixophyes fleayi]